MEQDEIRARLDDRSEAIRAKDLDRLMSFYSPGVVYFDVVPPLRYTGTVALHARFTDWFEGYESGIVQEISDLSIAVSGDLAVTSMLIRSGGTFRSGGDVRLWVRATSCFTRSSDTWLITHEHVSVPADLRPGRAATGLVPGQSSSGREGVSPARE